MNNHRYAAYFEEALEKGEGEAWERCLRHALRRERTDDVAALLASQISRTGKSDQLYDLIWRGREIPLLPEDREVAEVLLDALPTYRVIHSGEHYNANQDAEWDEDNEYEHVEPIFFVQTFVDGPDSDEALALNDALDYYCSAQDMVVGSRSGRYGYHDCDWGGFYENYRGMECYGYDNADINPKAPGEHYTITSLITTKGFDLDNLGRFNAEDLRVIGGGNCSMGRNESRWGAALQPDPKSNPYGWVFPEDGPRAEHARNIEVVHNVIEW